MVYEGTPNVKKLNTSMSPRNILTEDFPKHQWPISGGWGYTMDDAVILELDNEYDGVAFEYKFVEYRSYEEAIIFRSREDRLAGFRFKGNRQALVHGKDGKVYDKLEITVSAFLEEDLKYLQNDWQEHNGFKDDEDGKQRHLKMFDSKVIKYTVTCWFDITKIFGNK